MRSFLINLTLISLFLISTSIDADNYNGGIKTNQLKIKNKIILDLALKIKEDKHLASLIELSIRQAKTIAKKELKKELYEVLMWPENIEDYLIYLEKFSRYIPKPNEDDTKKKHIDEINNLISQFYWLINQKVEEGKSLEDHKWFNDWVVRYVQVWGEFLDTTESFDQNTLNMYLTQAPKYRVEDSMIFDPITQTKKPNSPSGWLTYNQFFARELNPGLRPINSPFDNRMITSPADCFYKETFPINSSSNIPAIRIKNTHEYANIEELLSGSAYSKEFRNGTFVHYYLDTFSYHRLHFPVSGLLRESRVVRGRAYSSPMIKNHEFAEDDLASGGYEFLQMRGFLIIDTTHSPYGNVGLVAVIPVGMSQVSSVNLTAATNKEFLKGDEFGYFLYGGSDIIILFQEKANVQIDRNRAYHHVGSKIAICESDLNLH